MNMKVMDAYRKLPTYVKVQTDPLDLRQID